MSLDILRSSVRFHGLSIRRTNAFVDGLGAPINNDTDALVDGL